MKRILTIAILGLAGAALLGPPGVAVAAKVVQDVFITNTSANPVPVAGTVDVGNLPASQEVTGTVDVGNLPAPDHAPAETFDAEAILAPGIGGFPVDSEVLLEVPEGKTAVIETASAWFQGEVGFVPRVTISQGIIGVGGSKHFLALSQQGVAAVPSDPDFQRAVFTGTEPLRMYAPAGSTVRADVFLPLLTQGQYSTSTVAIVSVSGYFVSTPAAPGA
jgi:hypothetical protein